jgi:sugar/nucleoside kinase (ribokinase family)
MPWLSLPPPRDVDVVGFGENSVDLVAVAPVFPVPDSKIVLASLDRRPGGQVATAMVVAASLGCHLVYVGVFGDDSDGRWLENELKRRSVDVRPIRKPGVGNRQALIVVESTSGRRTVMEHRDARLDLVPGDIDLDVFTRGRVLLVDGTDPKAAADAAAAARQAGTRVVLDVDRSSPALTPLLRQADILIVSASFPTAHTGATDLEEGLRRLTRDTQASLVVATLGEHGSVALYGGHVIRTPALRVTAVDTTGAGDAFRAGFIAAWLHGGESASLDTVLTQANRVAGLSCLGPGAWGAVPTWADVAGV